LGLPHKRVPSFSTLRETPAKFHESWREQNRRAQAGRSSAWGYLSPVYHGERSGLEVQHLARSYQTLTEDTTRVMGRLKAVFRGQAIGCIGKKLYGNSRAQYLAQGWRIADHQAFCFTLSTLSVTQLPPTS